MKLKDKVRQKGMELMADPRMMKLMKNEQVMKAMMTVVQVPGRVNAFTTDQQQRFARAMNLATAQEYKDLARKAKSLEGEVGRLKKKLEEAQGR